MPQKERIATLEDIARACAAAGLDCTISCERAEVRRRAYIGVRWEVRRTSPETGISPHFSHQEALEALRSVRSRGIKAKLVRIDRYRKDP